MRKIKTNLCILLCGLLALSATGCARQISAMELSGGYQRQTKEKGEVTGEFKQAMAEFALSLFKGSVTKDQENDLISPLSAMLCLGMISNGAEGDTRKQMEEAFGMKVDALNQCLYAYTSSLYSGKKCKLGLANSIWFREQEDWLQVKESFLQTNADWYEAQIYEAAFDASTLKDINTWCKEKTGGMIEEMLQEISGEDVMYLINALTFDAKWAQKYEDKDVCDREFTNYDGSKKQVPMLFSEETVFLSGQGAKGFAKSYEGNAYSFVGLLPPEGTDLYGFIASMDGKDWLNLWEGRQNKNVSVTMPEFTCSIHQKLNGVLQDMGMEDMFDSGKADFSGIGQGADGNLYCDSVEQKAYIEVNRNGTKAAALTWGNIKTESSMEEEWIALDRPFVYAIVDQEAGLPLFMGCVTNFN